MAVTPWSFSASNGTATAAGMRDAYTAITTNGVTASYSRLVWNDLVTKINAVAVALGRGWNDAYLSKIKTGMGIYLSPLSGQMFNSARYNTNYGLWTFRL